MGPVCSPRPQVFPAEALRNVGGPQHLRGTLSIPRAPQAAEGLWSEPSIRSGPAEAELTRMSPPY